MHETGQFRHTLNDASTNVAIRATQIKLSYVYIIPVYIPITICTRQFYVILGVVLCHLMHTCII